MKRNKEDTMKNKKILAILTISAIVSAAATGCSFGGDEPEEQVVVTETPAPEAVSYTHLDVYKRQFLHRPLSVV